VQGYAGQQQLPPEALQQPQPYQYAQMQPGDPGAYQQQLLPPQQQQQAQPAPIDDAQQQGRWSHCPAATRARANRFLHACMQQVWRCAAELACARVCMQPCCSK
jgi:hypothetical protein